MSQGPGMLWLMATLAIAKAAPPHLVTPFRTTPFTTRENGCYMTNGHVIVELTSNSENLVRNRNFPDKSNIGCIEILLLHVALIIGEVLVVSVQLKSLQKP